MSTNKLEPLPCSINMIIIVFFTIYDKTTKEHEFVNWPDTCFIALYYETTPLLLFLKFYLHINYLPM